MDLEHYCLAVLTIHCRKPEFVGASGPAIPGHGLERSGRGGHRREHFMAGQHAQRAARLAPQRPAADGSAYRHAHAQQHQDSSAGDNPATEPVPARRIRCIGGDKHVRDACAEQHAAAGHGPPGHRFGRPFGCCAPSDTAAAARNLLDEHVREQNAEHGPEDGHAGAAQHRVRSAAHEYARHALHAAGCQSKQSPLAPWHPQHPPDGGHIVEVSHAAVQLARPGYHENRTAADGTPRNDRLYDLINIDHPAAR